VWRDISLVWLVFWTLIAILPIAAVLFFAIWGMHRLRPAARNALRVVQPRAQQVSEATSRLSVRLAAPAIQLHARAAQADRLRNVILRRKEG